MTAAGSQSAEASTSVGRPLQADGDGLERPSCRRAWQQVPLSVDLVPQSTFDQRRQRQLLWALIGVGILARTMRYLLRMPLWPDEAYLATNFLDRGYADLTAPLDHDQVCPLLFLWVELTFVKLCGFTEYSLRVFPLLCGVGSLFVFKYVAGRLLQGTAQLPAVGIFAAAYPLIRYSSETKPYATDVLVTLSLLALFLAWWRSDRKHYPLAALLAFVPIGLGLSYPAVFVAAGIGVAMAAVLLAGGRPRQWIGWGLYNLAVAGSFFLWFLLCTRNQMRAASGTMQDCWHETFPPLDSVWGLAKWLVQTHVGDMAGYPIGDVSILTAAACIAALYICARQRQYVVLLLCLAPLTINLIAAALHRYPYGGPVRLMLYAAPVVCLLAGVGAARLMVGYNRPPRAVGLGAMLAATAILALVPAGTMLRDFVRPYKTSDFQRQRDFARGFWPTMAEDGEVVCLHTDFGPQPAERPPWTYASAVYFCNQRIYSPRHAREEPPDFERVSLQRPLRCVQVFVDERHLDDDPAADAQIAALKSRFRLAGVQTYRLTARVREGGDEILYCNWVRVYEFVPAMTTDGSTGFQPVSPQPRWLCYDGCLWSAARAPCAAWSRRFAVGCDQTTNLICAKVGNAGRHAAQKRR